MALVLLKASESTGLDHPQDHLKDTDQLDGPDVRDTAILRAHSNELRFHTEAMRAAENFKRSEAALLDALIAVDRAKVFVKLGYPSLFKYAVEALKLSEPTAYNCITVARKSREVPALQESISMGALSVSKAKKIAAVITPANQNEWIEKAQTLSSRQLEKEVARENPRLATPERATYVSGKRLELTLGVEEALMLKLRRAQDQVSRSKNRPVTLEETLEELASFYLKHKDPVEKAKRVIAKKGFTSASTHAGVKPDYATQSTRPVNSVLSDSIKQKTPNAPRLVRTPIPTHIAHQVRLRDQGQCQFKTPPSRNCINDANSPATPVCGSHRWTDLHHIQPVSQGGQHTRDNLITLCKAHHQHTHSKSSQK